MTGMRMELLGSLEFEQRQTITLEDRMRLQRLCNFRDQRTPEVISFSVAELRDLFGSKNSRKNTPLLEGPAGERRDANSLPPDFFEQEFIVLSPKELAEVEPEEKTAGFLGSIMYISSDVPEAFRPIVIFNLMVLSKLHGQHAEAILDMCGLPRHRVDEEMNRHWSANMIDVALASKHFGSQSQEFHDFLEWRKQVERTDFFRTPEFDEFINKRLSEQRYRRTTHPLNRGKWNRQSWSMAGVVKDLGLESMAKNLGVSRVDLLANALMKEPSFNPNEMLALIHFMKGQHISTDTTLDLSGDEMLDRQAYLLTEAIAGKGAVLRVVHKAGVYRPLAAAMTSLAALEDRIAFFAGRHLQESGVTPELLLALQRSKPVRLETIDIDLNVDQPEMLEQKITRIYDKITEVDALLAQLAEVEVQMSQLASASSVNVVPASVTEQREQLLTLRAALEAQVSAVESAMNLMRTLAAIREKQGNVLSVIPSPRLFAEEDESVA